MSELHEEMGYFLIYHIVFIFKLPQETNILILKTKKQKSASAIQPRRKPQIRLTTDHFVWVIFFGTSKIKTLTKCARNLKAALELVLDDNRDIEIF